MCQTKQTDNFSVKTDPPFLSVAVFTGTDLGQPAAFQALQHGDDLIVNEPVGSQNMPFADVEGLAGQIAYPAAGLAYDRDSGRHVPGAQLGLPEAVQAAGGRCAETASRRSLSQAPLPSSAQKSSSASGL